MKDSKFYHITITICYEDESQNTQHFLREYSQQEYDKLYREDDNFSPDWENIFHSFLNISKNGDMDIDEEIITEGEFNSLYNNNGWTWITKL